MLAALGTGAVKAALGRLLAQNAPWQYMKSIPSSRQQAEDQLPAVTFWLINLLFARGVKRAAQHVGLLLPTMASAIELTGEGIVGMYADTDWGHSAT